MIRTYWGTRYSFCAEGFRKDRSRQQGGVSCRKVTRAGGTGGSFRLSKKAKLEDFNRHYDMPVPSVAESQQNHEDGEYILRLKELLAQIPQPSSGPPLSWFKSKVCWYRDACKRSDCRFGHRKPVIKAAKKLQKKIDRDSLARIAEATALFVLNEEKKTVR